MADASVYYRSDLPQDQNIAPRLGTPGTPDFFASILEFVRATAPDVPLDPVIFQAIVLCVMAGNKHVLLRPREEDITVVQNLAALIFVNIFGYATHKHKIAPSSGSIPPSSFVPSILSLPYQGTPTSKVDPSSKMRSKRSQSHSTPDDHRRHGRQGSELDVSSSSSQRERTNTRSSFHRTPFHAAGTRFGSSGSTEPESPLVLHGSSSTPWMPTAVVVTGLEHSSVPCHRALLRTLLENRVAFDEDPGGAKHPSWDLPEDFVLVYVCGFDPRERPSVHKSLLDKFSLSVPVALHPNTRQAYTAYLASYPDTRSPSQASTPAQQPTTPIIPRDFFPRLRSLSTQAHVNIHASLRLYIADLIGAARHHHELDGTLLGARCVQDAEALVRAHRVLGSGDVGSALVERAAALPSTSAAESLTSLHDGSVHLQWATIGPSTTSLRSQSDASGTEADWLHVDPRESWDVSEVDAAKVVPRVISHRLRVRDGPEDEMMAGVVHLATAPRVPAGVESKEGVWRRRTVKEILVKLIGEV